MNIEKTTLQIETIKGKKQAKIPRLKKQAAVSAPYVILESYTQGCIGHGTALVADNPGPGNHLTVQDFLVRKHAKNYLRLQNRLVLTEAIWE